MNFPKNLGLILIQLAPSILSSLGAVALAMNAGWYQAFCVGAQ